MAVCSINNEKSAPAAGKVWLRACEDFGSLMQVPYG